MNLARAAPRVLGVGGTIVFTLSWLAMGWARPGYSQRRETISALAAPGAPGRWIMVAAFVALGVALAASAFVTARYSPVAATLIGLGALGTLVAGAFPTSCGNPAWCRPVTFAAVTGPVHASGAGLSFATLPLAMLVIAGTRRRANPDRAIAALVFVVAVPTLAWFLFSDGDSRGLAEKIYISLLIGWCAARSAWTRRAPRGGTDPMPPSTTRTGHAGRPRGAGGA